LLCFLLGSVLFQVTPFNIFEVLFMAAAHSLRFYLGSQTSLLT
jgi:hypothetical protein